MNIFYPDAKPDHSSRLIIANPTLQVSSQQRQVLGPLFIISAVAKPVEGMGSS